MQYIIFWSSRDQRLKRSYNFLCNFQDNYLHYIQFRIFCKYNLLKVTKHERKRCSDAMCCYELLAVMLEMFWELWPFDKCTYRKNVDFHHGSLKMWKVNKFWITLWVNFKFQIQVKCAEVMFYIELLWYFRCLRLWGCCMRMLWWVYKYNILTVLFRASSVNVENG